MSLKGAMLRIEDEAREAPSGTAGGVVPAYIGELGKWPACVALIACALAATGTVALVGWRMPEAAEAAISQGEVG